ncbi:FimB/Mfa2 family fimbrial subunit [uncultured Butyricimonas sp.]|uniref:FimB/Mfa2 family fimbrial subunit n=1 Tax=uncultured Butyricimonas sp. TaxID=1268785 RepID=UPI0026DC4CC8|nr:FimB/Mfa2 family fimbrial subunit [uncultured Butyricimonas sp.]
MAMKRIGIYGIVIIFGLLGCEKESDWEGGTSNTEGLKRVSIQMAIEEGASFEKYIHSLAVFAFQETDDSFVYYKKVADLTAGDIHNLESGMASVANSKMLKMTLPAGLYRFYYLANDLSNEYVEPPRGGSVEQGYLPFPPVGVEQAYFMGEVEMKPGTDESTPLFVVLSRVVSRLTVVITGIPDQVDSVRYRVEGISSRVLLTEATAGDMTSYTGIYSRDIPASADTVISRLLLFPGSGAKIGFQFFAGTGVVKEKTIPVSGLVPNNDVFISGRWEETGTTRLSRIFSTPFYNSSHSGD